MSKGKSLVAVYRRVRLDLLSTCETILGAFANVVFASDLRVGAWVFAAACVDVRRGLLGACGVVSARWSLLVLGEAPNATKLAAYTCCSALVAMTLPHTSLAAALFLAGMGGVVTAWLAVVLSDLFGRLLMPTFALPFVLVGWGGPFVIPHYSEVVESSTSSLALSAEVVGSWAVLVESVVRSLGALLWNPRLEVGIVVLAAIGLWSRWAALAAVTGSCIGVLICQVVLGSRQPTELLPAQYNAALTMLALACCVGIPNLALTAVAICAASASALTAVLLQRVLVTVGLPILAWPFVIVSLLTLRVLHVKRPAWFEPLLLPGQSAEVNLSYRSMLRLRLASPGPVRLVLPFSGSWCVTQGVDGGITHRGPWAFALDFEVMDDEGFPFRERGTEPEQYHCFNLPVLAPGFGTVAAVFDRQEDSRPGEFDLERPWGNAVIICHGYACYSVLAHLRPGSIGVKVGDPVVPGQVIAACGSSGRSPRPHLHLQVQASAELGAAAIPFALVDYLTRAAGKPALTRVGVPNEWDVVCRVQPSVNRQTEFWQGGCTLLDARARRHSLSVVTNELGERYLVDDTCNDRLYFVPGSGGLVFTTLRGARSGLLGALYIVLPWFPCATVGSCRVVERVALDTVGHAWRARVRRWWHDPVPSFAEIHMDVTAAGNGRISVVSNVWLGTAERARIIGVGRAELGADGLHVLELEMGTTSRVWRNPSWPEPRGTVAQHRGALAHEALF